MREIKISKVGGGDPEEGLMFVEVIVSHMYACHCPKGNWRSPEELLKEYFVDFDINRSHAGRDGDEVGFSKKITSIEYKAPGEEKPKKFIVPDSEVPNES